MLLGNLVFVSGIDTANDNRVSCDLVTIIHICIAMSLSMITKDYVMHGMDSMNRCFKVMDLVNFFHLYTTYS